MKSMSESPKLEVSLAGEPRQVVILARDVAYEDWYRIALLLADQTPPVDVPLLVQPDRFLRERLALRGLLTELGVQLDIDEGVRLLLLGNQADQRAFNDALRGRLVLSQGGAQDQDDGRRVVRVLRLFQQRDLETLAGLAHGANFSVPGAGKTTVTYVLHARERAAGRADKLLVVAPLSAFGAWEDEVTEVLDPPLRVARWRGADVPDADVILVNYQRLPSAVGALTDLMIRRRTHLVVDEAHRAKRGAMGEWGRALLAIAPFAARRDVLTGTPAPNHPRDLVSILDILWPGNVARNAIPRGVLRNDPTQAEMQNLSRIIAPLYVRTTKNELRLPDLNIYLDSVPLGNLQQQIYDAMLDRYTGVFDLDRRDQTMFAQMGEVAMYLLQAASSPRLLSSGSDPARAYRFPSLAIPSGSRLARLVDSYADYEVPAKVERACRIIYANVQLGRKTLVWSNFPGNLLDLERQLSGLNPALVYGAIPSNDEAEPGVRTRERELERFRNDPDCWVLLANPAAMSEGVSLHLSCNDAIYIDRTFNAGQYLQSLDRIHRLGLPPGVDTRVTILSSAGTIDERVNARVEDKARRLAQILDDPDLAQMALPDDGDVGEVIDDELDLLEVLGLLQSGPRGRVNDA
jgi:SNF2 family DNA or RNA helicase